MDAGAGSSIYNDADRDKKVLLLDDSAYIVDDFGAVMDDVWDLGAGKPLMESGYGAAIYIGIRELLTGGYAGCVCAAAVELAS